MQKSVRSNKKGEQERKRDERAARRAIANDRKNRPQDGDEGAEFVSFSNQLQALGLKLREVPGDGFVCLLCFSFIATDTRLRTLICTFQ